MHVHDTISRKKNQPFLRATRTAAALALNQRCETHRRQSTLLVNTFLNALGAGNCPIIMRIVL